MSASLSITGLSKTYPGTRTPALDNLTLHVKPGEVYGFLGANGAGKTTTIRLLLNLLRPSGGSAAIMGLDIVRDSVNVKKHVGYLSGEIALWPKVTGHELFTYLAKLQQKDCRKYTAELIKRFEAEPQKRIGDLSKGNRQKIGIIQALMHQPDVLVLDEPTSGLDPLMQEVFYDAIKEASARGAAVFVSSHNLAETQRMCRRVGIIKHGKLIREEDIQQTGSFASTLFRVVFRHPKDVETLLHSKAIKVVSHKHTTVMLQPTGALHEALAVLSNYDIASLTTEQPSLEDEFLSYYGDGA